MNLKRIVFTGVLFTSGSILSPALATQGMTLFAQTTQRGAQQHALQIRGIQIAIGDQIGEVNRKLGKIYQMTFSNPGEWRYEETKGYPEARISVSDGKVTKVTKYLYISGRRTSSDRALEELFTAGQEFRSLVAAINCSIPDTQKASSTEGTVNLTYTCGPYTLKVNAYKYPTGELGLSSEIELRKE